MEDFEQKKKKVRDFLGYGRTIYHINKTIRENGIAIDDGEQEIFLNTSVNDGTDIAGLMQCFLSKTVEDARFPVLSARVKYLKEEGGVSEMCELMERYMEEARIEAREKALEEGQKQERLRAIRKLIQKNYSREAILELEYTEEEYAEAVEEMLRV